MDVLRTEMCTAFDVGTSRWKSLSRKRDPSYIRTDKLDARRNSDSRPPLHLLERFKRIESENRGVARNSKLISIGKPPPPLPSPSKFLSKLSTNFLGQLLHRDSVHRSIIPPLPQVSITRRRDNSVNFPSDALHRSPFSLPCRNRTDSIVRLLIRAALQKEALRAIHLTRTFSLVYLSITFYFLRSDK